MSDGTSLLLVACHCGPYVVAGLVNVSPQLAVQIAEPPSIYYPSQRTPCTHYLTPVLTNGPGATCNPSLYGVGAQDGTVNELWTAVHVDNLASRAAFLKSGFKEVAT